MLARIQSRKRGNPNHPVKGSSTRVEPIRSLKDIGRIKDALSEKPRDLCYFTLGINTAFRANELLSITVGQVAHLHPWDSLCLKQSKTGKHRSVKLNPTAIDAIQNWLAVHPNPDMDEPLFCSRKMVADRYGGSALQVPTVSGMVKYWCKKAGLKGNYGSHSLRKTWGYQQLRRNENINRQASIGILMTAYGHSSPDQTLKYLCISSEEVDMLYTLEL